MASKLATALAVGSTTVIKPSELSAWQTQILTECLHAAELPPGLFNVVTGKPADKVVRQVQAVAPLVDSTVTGAYDAYSERA